MTSNQDWEIRENVEKHNYKFICPRCGKFLARSMVKITGIGISHPEFQRIRKAVVVVYGTQTKCRSCKKIRQTEKVAELTEQGEIISKPVLS